MIRSFAFHVVNIILAILVYPGIAFIFTLIGLGIAGSAAQADGGVGAFFALIALVFPWLINLALLIYSIVGVCVVPRKPRHVYMHHVGPQQAYVDPTLAQKS